MDEFNVRTLVRSAQGAPRIGSNWAARQQLRHADNSKILHRAWKTFARSGSA
jgi:hypothetical protein